VKRSLILLLVAASALPAEKLFDGKTFRHFHTPTRETGPEVSWRIVDGVLESLPKAERQCDLWTDAEYENFDLRFDWKVAPGGNSGIKYMIQFSAVDHLDERGRKYIHENTLGYEFQLADAGPAPQAAKGANGALYGYLAPVELAAKPTSEWNTGRLVLNGRNVEHWINGHRVLAYSLDSAELHAALRAKNVKSARMMDQLVHRITPICFQHHNSAVAFRNIRIKVLKP